MKFELKCYESNRSLGSTDRRSEHRWEWVCGIMAEVTGCDPDVDEIHAVETDDGDEIHVNDKPVARVQYHYGWEAIGVG